MGWSFELDHTAFACCIECGHTWLIGDREARDNLPGSCPYCDGPVNLGPGDDES